MGQKISSPRAFLGDFGDDDPQTVSMRLLEKLRRLTDPDEGWLRDYLSMLEILADNRPLTLNLQEAYACCKSTSNGCLAIRRVWNREWKKACVARRWRWLGNSW